MRVTAAGSLPGDDFRGALKAMTEALPEVLPLPELPARGVASAMVGRALGLIDGLNFDLQPAGWRLTANSDADHRRARAQWRHDLDDAEELLQGFDATLKVAVAGPLTLAASVERPAGDRLLADHGARRELAEALTDGVATLRADLARRLPEATLLIQVDEPAMRAVIDGQIPTASGFGKHRSIAEPEAIEILKPLADGALLHCCAPGRWLDVARRAGFAGVAVDSRLADLDELAQWSDERRTLVLGVVETSSARPQSVDELTREALRVLREIQTDIGEHLLLGTACGLAGWRHQDVLRQLENLTRAASLVEENLARG
ncbi:MAG: methionine synthase [Propionibacteriaceae bacterium]|nr:methionine synthase [Propionibacteriaceae bacterium]